MAASTLPVSAMATSGAMPPFFASAPRNAGARLAAALTHFAAATRMASSPASRPRKHTSTQRASAANWTEASFVASTLFASIP